MSASFVERFASGSESGGRPHAAVLAGRKDMGFADRIVAERMRRREEPPNTRLAPGLAI